MDPQQRLVLELAWEALEDGPDRAGRRCADSRTGVFVGAIYDDYADAGPTGSGRSRRTPLTGVQRSMHRQPGVVHCWACAARA